MNSTVRSIGLNVGFLAGVAAFVLSAAGAGATEAPIATAQKTNGSARVDILSLKRTEGDTLTLRFAVTNGGNANLSITTGNLKLVDLVNRRTYDAGVYSPCVIEPDQRANCWAVFAAPNASVKSINVNFYEDFGLISTPIAE
jgi:hypothetical protein